MKNRTRTASNEATCAPRLFTHPEAAADSGPDVIFKLHLVFVI